MRLVVIMVVVLALVGATGYAWLGDGGRTASALGWSRAEAGALDPGAEVDAGASTPGALAAGGAGAPDESEDSAAGDTHRATDPRVVAAASSKSVVYQWVDDRGSVHFAGSLDEVPVDWRSRAGQIELDASALSRTSAAPAASSGESRGAAEVAAAQPAHEVTVYTAPWCGWCRKTLAFLDEAGVEYVNKDIEADVRWAEELREKTGGNAIPLVEIDGSRIRGFDPDQMTSLLD